MNVSAALLFAAAVVAGLAALATALALYDAWWDWRHASRMGWDNGRLRIAGAHLRSQAVRLAVLLLFVAVAVLAGQGSSGDAGVRLVAARVLFLTAQVMIAFDAWAAWRTNRRLIREFRP